MGERAAETWEGFGVTPIMPAAGLRALPTLLACCEPQRVVANMVWPEASVPTEPARPDPGPVTVSRLQGLLAPLLGVRDPTTLEPETPLLSFGLDFADGRRICSRPEPRSGPAGGARFRL